MEYDVMAESGAIDFGASGAAEILQNVRTILTTPLGSVPLDRVFGIDFSMLDGPINEATRARLAAAIVNGINKHEPRCSVTKVTFQEDQLNGRLIPKVRVKINE